MVIRPKGRHVVGVAAPYDAEARVGSVADGVRRLRGDGDVHDCTSRDEHGKAGTRTGKARLEAVKHSLQSLRNFIKARAMFDGGT